jgi:hypothetical protein
MAVLFPMNRQPRFVSRKEPAAAAEVSATALSNGSVAGRDEAGNQSALRSYLATM